MATDRGFGHSVFLGEGASGVTPRRSPALVAVLLWAAAGLSVGYWVLQVLGQSPLTPVAATASLPVAPEPAALARVLGAAPEAVVAVEAAAPPPLASRFQLLGVIAEGAEGGAALIAVDGQPPKPYRVGAELEGGVVLQSVQRRSARLVPVGSSGGAPIELSLPPPPGAAS
ncbi:MAG: general secretion pathway protein C [Hydrogenophaga sp.]|uniref:type II secretion system protein N n=1 Tax=Hydrogenophaga sp. TaxID=1904254 RepID=UPI001D56E855|nr:type II secretion system protein N [Hydrogenophaga sp.]MBX3609739.1 general secretion pathway protein C [Hydrogenophaga sp.]